MYIYIYYYHSGQTNVYMQFIVHANTLLSFRSNQSMYIGIISEERKGQL